MLFELIPIEVKRSKNYLKHFLPRESGASGNNMEKKSQKPHPRLKKTLNFYREYLLCLQSSASGSFLQTCINFLEQRLQFSHSKGSIIP